MRFGRRPWRDLAGHLPLTLQASAIASGGHLKRLKSTAAQIFMHLGFGKKTALPRCRKFGTSTKCAHNKPRYCGTGGAAPETPFAPLALCPKPSLGARAATFQPAIQLNKSRCLFSHSQRFGIMPNSGFHRASQYRSGRRPVKVVRPVGQLHLDRPRHPPSRVPADAEAASKVSGFSKGRRIINQA